MAVTLEGALVGTVVVLHVVLGTGKFKTAGVR